MRGQAREDNSTDERKTRINQRGKRKGGAGGRKRPREKKKTREGHFLKKSSERACRSPLFRTPIKGLVFVLGILDLEETKREG